jgi:hypothetical protein
MAQEYSPEICVNAIADPASINVDDWKDCDNEGILYVPKAGEILYRLRR